MTECDKIVLVMNIASTKKANTIATKMTNTIATNITSTASINYHSKKVRDCYILSFISNHTTIENYYHLLSLCKTKKH